MNELIILGIWTVVIGVIFAVAWRKGYLLRLANYVIETREELRKCAWPSFGELKGSTAVVMVAIAFLGLFTVVADLVLSKLLQWITP